MLINIKELIGYVEVIIVFFGCLSFYLLASRFTSKGYTEKLESTLNTLKEEINKIRLKIDFLEGTYKFFITKTDIVEEHTKNLVKIEVTIQDIEKKLNKYLDKKN